MNKLYELAAGHTARFPDGNKPFQIVTILLEECGEVASEVNHFERSGVKVQKHGEPSKQHMAGEIKQCMLVLIQLAQYYKIEDELERSIDESLERIRREQGT